MKTRGLKKAERLFASGRYADVIHILEPQIFMYREHPRFYYLLGVSCLEMGDLGGAYSYVSRSAQLDPEDVDALLALAAVHVRRNQTREALRLWLDVLDQEPRNRQARRGLQILRRAETNAEIQERLSERRIQQLLPRRPFPVRRVAIWTLLPAAVAAAVFGALALPWDQVFTRDAGEEREGADILAVDTRGEQVIEYSEDARYELSEDQVRGTLEEVREHFHEGRDNLARRGMNRLLNSNASSDIKERMMLAADYLREPDFTDFGENFSYREVSKEPWLYDGAYVRWSGRAANVEIGEDDITFDLLVGYHDGRVLEGVVPVRLDFSARVESTMGVELIGEVVGEDELEGLRGVAIRMIRPEQD
ncbi:MAG: tetratricopeptide repeat protein [Spirochaetaceae bacterium]